MVSGSEPAAIAAMDRFIFALASLRQGAEAVLAAADQCAGVPLLQTYAAQARLYAQSRRADRSAGEYLRRASTGALMSSGFAGRSASAQIAAREPISSGEVAIILHIGIFFVASPRR